ncbi:hypothetical protein BHE74_00055592 [Ensete ventricosum]|nr:hypothetical protein BHE74_00055592 [Ensete ventricosum]
MVSEPRFFVRKIGFKLRVMRLYCIESFYAFLLRFRSEGSPRKGQPGMAMASPLAGAAGHLQGGGRGSSPVGTNGCGQATRAYCPQRDHKGQPPATRPEVAVASCKAARGSPAARTVAYKGGVGRSSRQQGQRPHEAALLVHEVPPEGSSDCPHRRRAAPPPAQGSGDGADGGKERARASF